MPTLKEQIEISKHHLDDLDGMVDSIEDKEYKKEIYSYLKEFVDDIEDFMAGGYNPDDDEDDDFEE